MQQPFTRVDWERLPEGFPAQLIQGQLVKEPAPTYGHQRLGARIRFALLSLLGPDRVPDTPADVLVDDVNVYQPDVVVLRAPADDASHYVGVPLLAVEVLSRSTRKRDRDVKAERLLVLGVEEVWLVDPERRRDRDTQRRASVVSRPSATSYDREACRASCSTSSRSSHRRAGESLGLRQLVPGPRLAEGTGGRRRRGRTARDQRAAGGPSRSYSSSLKPFEVVRHSTRMRAFPSGVPMQ